VAFVENFEVFNRAIVMSEDGKNVYLLGRSTITIPDRSISMGDTILVTGRTTGNPEKWTVEKTKCEGTVPPEHGFGGLFVHGHKFDAIVRRGDMFAFFTSEDGGKTWKDVPASEE
jgi:hypothetical protein